MQVSEQPKLDFTSYFNQLPPFIARKDVSKLLGGTISPKTLANADSLGKGPEVRTSCGKTVVYETESLLKWMNSKRS
jgi:hypothetical protein